MRATLSWVALAVPLTGAASAIHASRLTTRGISCAGGSQLRASTPTMGLFDGFAAAFANDETLGEAGPAGLKDKAVYHTITWEGPKPEGAAAIFEKQKVTVSQAIAGQPMKDVAATAEIPIRYSCMKVSKPSHPQHRQPLAVKAAIVLI